MDIFETLKSMLGCMYLSDLRFGAYKEMALELLKEMNTDTTEAYNYIMGGI